MANDSNATDGSGSGRKRILLVAESVTLAHVSRLVALGGALDPVRYEVHLACDARYLRLLGELSMQHHPLWSRSSDDFLRSLRAMGPIFGLDLLRRYVKDELSLIDRVEPDLIIGDFRISLGVSTRLAKVPLAVLVNAYWSPFARVPFHMPDIWLARVIGARLADRFFSAFQRQIFATHAGPLNKVCKERGLKPIGNDLREVFCYGDFTLYPDLPELIPTEGLPASHRYLGPVLWSPEIPRPAWWDDLRRDRPIVYVTLGSSGEGKLLPVVLTALANLDVTVIASTAGASVPERLPANVLASEFLPGTEAAAMSSLVICNGGSPTGYQGLAGGAPVLGLAANMDQQLNMECMQQAGVGLWIRAMDAEAECIGPVARQLLERGEYKDAAGTLAHGCSEARPEVRLADLLDEALPN